MMKKVTRLAFIAALALSSTAPAMADAINTRPAAVTFAAPTGTSAVFSAAPVSLDTSARAGKSMVKKSKLFGAINLSALLPFLATIFGFPSVDAFIKALQTAAGQSPA